ncbi:MAG TPA: hypothetical protein VMU77_05945, partial [Acidimicrobiales bacterium]|nr:hypothetical protein [Acidimicrobiales bacterium]
MAPPEGQVSEGWWQASDGNWYPPELHPEYDNDILNPPAGALGLRVKLRRNWSWLGLNLGKYAGSVAIIGLLISLILGLGFARLKFTTSNASYLNSTDPAAIENGHYQALFGGDPIVTMFTMNPGTTVDSFFSQANSAQLDSLESRLRADPAVFSVAGPADALTLANTLASSPDGNAANSIAGKLLLSADQRDPSATSQAVRLKFMAQLLAEQSAIPASLQNVSNPVWVHFLTHNPDGSMRASVLAFIPNENHLAMIVYLNGGLSIDQEARAARSVQAIISTSH